jgi:hypothetical protein
MSGTRKCIGRISPELSLCLGPSLIVGYGKLESGVGGSNEGSGTSLERACNSAASYWGTGFRELRRLDAERSIGIISVEDSDLRGEFLVNGDGRGGL